MEGERDGTVEIYVATRNASRARRARAREEERELDPIDPNLLGCTDLHKIYRVAHGNGWSWAENGLRLVRGLDQPVLRAREAGTPPIPQVHVSPFMHARWPQLVEGGLLRKAAPRMTWLARCGLFEVEKSNSLMRVIFDARPANRVLERMAGPLSLFRVEDLCAVVARWLEYAHATGKAVTAATIDFRHFFYQVPLRQELGRCFAIVVDGETLIPVVMPMGWQDAPKIAQAISTIVAIYDAHGESVAVDKTEIPTIITADGCHIFVLLDGIFVVGEEAAVRKHVERMNGNIRNFKIIPKNVEVQGGWSSCNFKEGESITFSGVVMSREGCRPEALGHTGRCDSAADWQSRVGSLLWALRVRQAGAETAQLLRHEWLLSLWGKIAAVRRQAGPGARVEATADERRRMGSMEKICYQPGFSPWARTERRLPTRVRISDASLEAWCYVEYSVTPDGRLGPELSRTWGAHSPESQVMAEANAAIQACQGTRESVALGLDADAVRHAIDKTYARTAALRAALRDILASGPLWTFRVPGSENVADADTRSRTRGLRDAVISEQSERRAQAALDSIWLRWSRSEWSAGPQPLLRQCEEPGEPTGSVVNSPRD